MSDRGEDVTAFATALATAIATVDGAAAAATWTAVRAAHPAIAVDPAAFAHHVGLALVAGDTPLAELCTADLLVAFACCRGDSTAIAELERLLAPVKGLMLRRSADSALVDDAVQTVRYRLLVATPHREAKLATYRGRGSLAGWLRVVGLRQLRASGVPRPERSDSTLGRIATEADATLAVLVRTHGPTVRRMFRDALATLDDRQRELLRLEIVDELPHQRIAELHGVHRTTVVRWIEDARQALAREVRRRLKRELELGDDSAESLLRTLANQVELSLGSGLVPAPPAPPAP